MIKNKKLKIVLTLILICIFFITIYKIMHIYAILQSDMAGNINFKNGAWNIFVNGTEVTDGTEKSFIIDKFVLEDSKKVKEGKIAPGTVGSFFIAINPENVDASVRYDISIDSQKITNKNIKITSITVNNGTEELKPTINKTFAGVITLEQIKAKAVTNIKVDVTWLNQETNNEEDTKLGSIYNTKLNIPIKIRFSQYLGEEIK